MPWRYISEDNSRKLEAAQPTSSSPQPAGDAAISHEQSDLVVDKKLPPVEVIAQEPTAPAAPTTSARLAEHVEPKIATRKRRGMQTPNNDDARGSFNFPFHNSASDARGDGLVLAPPQPFIVQAAPLPPSAEQPRLVSSTLPLRFPTSHHPAVPDTTRSPRFPGGYAPLTTDQSRSSSTAVQTTPTPSVVSFSFPEAPAIEVYRPGSSIPSEMPRSRVPTAVTRNQYTSHGPRVAATNTTGQRNRSSPRTIFSQYMEPAPAASSATVAAEAKHAFRSAGSSARNPGDGSTGRRLGSTSGVPDPPPLSSKPPYKRKPVINEGRKPQDPLSAAALAQLERKTPATRVAPPPAGANDRAPITRARGTAGGSSSSSSSTTTSSSASSKHKAVNAGKKRSVEGHVVESPRVQSATEVESGTDNNDMPNGTGSAQKRRRVDDSPVEPSVLTTLSVPPNVTASVTESNKEGDENSVYEDDESWSAMDELKTPHRNALSLRSRTIFSEDTPSPAHLVPVPPHRPALTIQIPVPPAEGKQIRAVAAAHNATSTSLPSLSTISNLTEVDALAGFASLSRGEMVSQGAGSVRLGHSSVAEERVPPIRVSRGNAAAAARGLRLRSAANRIS